MPLPPLLLPITIDLLVAVSPTGLEAPTRFLYPNWKNGTLIVHVLYFNRGTGMEMYTEHLSSAFFGLSFPQVGHKW